jgi:hypothetical protein
VKVNQANTKITSRLRLKKLGIETLAALAGTAFSAILLVLAAMHAGPLWRDEVNTLNVAQMQSLKELWGNMSFESFPPLWPLIVRAWDFFGLARDAGVRVLGLLVGLLFLVSLWLCSRWTGGRAPILSVGLMGALPAFIFIMGSNRAYGLGSCLLVLSFGMIWRMVQLPSRSRIILAGLTCFLFAHCVYYDVVFLCAMLTGGAIVAVRRRRWKTLAALAGVGAVSCASMLVYLPIIRLGSTYGPMIQQPFFNLKILWHKLGSAVTSQSSDVAGGLRGPEVWFWVALLLLGIAAAFVMQRHQARSEKAATAIATEARADLALFCVVSMVFGVLGYLAFLLKLHYVTQAWYYVEMLCLCAISLDGLLGANWPALRPWGLLRIGFMVAMMAWCAGPAWEEAHTRRSNVDLIANVLGKNAPAGDLIVVQSAWEGITFARYYHGRASWMTIPPIDSHKVHRNDLVLEKLNQPNPMSPVLREITSVLSHGNSVWVVGHVTVAQTNQLSPLPPPPGLPTKWWLQPYSEYWSAQVMAQLKDHAPQERDIEIPANGPVSRLENLPVEKFSGYKP